MKKKYIMFLAAALALTACGQEEKKPQEEKPVEKPAEQAPVEQKNEEQPKQ